MYHCPCFTEKEAVIQRGITTSLPVRLLTSRGAGIRARVSLIPAVGTVVRGRQRTISALLLKNHPLWGLRHGPCMDEVDLLPHSPAHVM